MDGNRNEERSLVYAKINKFIRFWICCCGGGGIRKKKSISFCDIVLYHVGEGGF